MEESRPRSIVRSGVFTTPSDTGFEVATHLAREWLSGQASEWQLPAPDFSKPLISGSSGSAKLIIQSGDGTFAFAFSHADERAQNVDWRVLGSITEREGNRCFVDIAIEVAGVWRGVVPPLGMPGFMAGIVDQIGLNDIWPLSTSPRRITVETAPAFVDFLTNRDRRLPIIALSTPLQMAPSDVERLGRRVAGSAHLVVVETPASFIISDKMGSEYSVYRGAVRVYHPRLSNSPFDVPLFFSTTVERITNTARKNGPFGVLRFADILVRSALDRTTWPPRDGIRDGSVSETPVQEQVVETSPVASTAALETQQPATEHLSAELPNLVVQEAPSAVGPPEAPVSEEPVEATQQAGAALDALVGPEEEATTTVERPSQSETNAEIEDLRARLDEAEQAKERYFYDFVRLEAENEELKKGLVSGLNSEVSGASEQDLGILRALSEAHVAVKAIIERSVATQTESQEFQDRLERLERDTRQQKYLIEQLRNRRDSGDEPAETVEPPGNYHDIDALERYLTARHGERLILHTNARRGLEDGLYDDSEHLVALLDLLGEQHYNTKTSVDGAWEAFEAERNRLHVKYSKALSPESLGGYGRHYEVSFEGKTVDVMDIWHVRSNGTSYDPRRMCALYFFWDEERQATVVTSGPAKLPTPADNT